MTQFQIIGGFGCVKDGRVYEEHPKFGRYKTPLITWVCLVTGERQSKYYALSNLREVEAVRHTVTAVDMGIMFTCEPPPQPEHTCALPPHMVDNIIALTEILNTRPQERQKPRDLYVMDLFERIEEVVAA